MVINYSIFRFSKIHSLEEFENKLKKYECSNRFYNGKEYKNEIMNDPEHQISGIKISNICGENVEYLSFYVNVQSLRQEKIQDRVTLIIAFMQDNKLILAFCDAKTYVERIIKNIFKEDYWGKLYSVNYTSEDMLYWLFYRLREFDNTAIIEDMYLNGISSYLGRTKDKINAVRGTGNRVSALLGTLGMLLGEENLRALRPEIQYKDFIVLMEMYIGNYGKIYIDKFEGPILSEIEKIIIGCKYVLPTLKQGYIENGKEGLWSLTVRREFLKNIGNDMQEKVDRELQKLNQELKKSQEGYEIDDDILDDDIEQLELFWDDLENELHIE
ncbi:MAG: hypothetical protein KH020_17535 [Clostridiales bacterium]|nr:hypothetical protein [Clostridiales bacterium]